MESPRTRTINIVGYGSLEPAWRGLGSDSEGDRDDARHVHPVPRAGGVELVRHHALHELPAVRVIPDGRVDVDPCHAPVGRHPEADAVGATAHGAGALRGGGQNRGPGRGDEKLTPPAPLPGPRAGAVPGPPPAPAPPPPCPPPAAATPAAALSGGS